MFNDKSILITGGTGSLGHALTKHISENYKPRKLIIFSRDEYKQSEMEKEYDMPFMRYFIGDVRDQQRLLMAFTGVDIVIHAAAMKQVPKCERDPEECDKTNIDGTRNVIYACVKSNVSKCVYTSTDKAVDPINKYGASKMIAEKDIIAANNYKEIFSCTRWGNIEGSRGSVIPFYKELCKKGFINLPVTDSFMARFTVNFDQAINTIEKAIESPSGLIWITKSKSYRILDLISSFGKKPFETTSRPGEKLHEILVSEYEISRSRMLDDFYYIMPDITDKNKSWFDISKRDDYIRQLGGKIPIREYRSDDNDMLTVDELKERIK